MVELQESSDARLHACWRIQDCKSCINSRDGCGWCPMTSSCIPSSSIWDPVRNEDICPHWAERWELRTKTLGCGCSTITLLACLITIACTIVGLFVLYGLWRFLALFNRLYGPGSWAGYELSFDAEGNKTESMWRQRKWWQFFVARRIIPDDLPRDDAAIEPFPQRYTDEPAERPAEPGEPEQSDPNGQQKSQSPGAAPRSKGKQRVGS